MFGLDCSKKQHNNTRNFSTIGGKTRLCAEVRSWKDGNTGAGTKKCGGNQFVPINGGGGGGNSFLATFSHVRYGPEKTVLRHLK